MQSNQAKVWLTGDAVVDLIPDGEAHYLKCPGGAPANVAVGISRLGGDVSFFGRVGLDPLGKFMQQVLREEGVDCAHLYLDPEHRTSTVIVDLDDTGERSFTFMVKPSADQFMQVTDVPVFEKGQWLHLCSIALANQPSREASLSAMQAMRDAQGFVSFDPNLREEVWADQSEIIPVVCEAIKLANVVKFSEEELCFLSGKDTLETGIHWLNESFDLDLVLITQGAAGALVILKGDAFQVPTDKVNVVDTTGAGDAFVGGLLAALSRYDNWQDKQNVMQAVKQANHCGGLATTAKGAMTALPRLADLALA